MYQGADAWIFHCTQKQWMRAGFHFHVHPDIILLLLTVSVPELKAYGEKISLLLKAWNPGLV